MISIILPVHNQRDLLPLVLKGIFDNSSSMVSELVVIMDGCTDGSEAVLTNWLVNNPTNLMAINVLRAPNVFEIKADNIGMGAANNPYAALMQDDMVIEEFGWDMRMFQPFKLWDDVFAVTARDALDTYLKPDGYLAYSNQVNWTNLPRTIFAVRDGCNRGPLMLDKAKVETLGYLDERYAPLAMDDVDICTRAWIEHQWVSGCYWVKVRSDLEWGTTRKVAHSRDIQARSELKNTRYYEKAFHDFIVGPKHSQDRSIF